MASVTISMPEEFKNELKSFSWVNWSELAREEALKRIQLAKDFDEFNKIVSKSKLTEKDALELGRKINASLHKRYKQLYSELK